MRLPLRCRQLSACELRHRSLNVTASGSDLGYKVHMKGPILAATFRF